MFCASVSVTCWQSSDCWRSSRNCWSRSERTASHASTRLGSRTASTKTSATFFMGLLREISQVRVHNQARISLNQKRHVDGRGHADLAGGERFRGGVRAGLVRQGPEILDIVLAVDSP